MTKDFEAWNRLKAHLDAEHPAPAFQQRGIWWCSIGVNIGHEEDGKNEYATRPVLIVRKFNAHLFLGVPLTTQIKDKPYYHRLVFRDRDQCVMLSQLRLWSAKRLRSRMGKLPRQQFEEVKRALRSLLN